VATVPASPPAAPGETKPVEATPEPQSSELQGPIATHTPDDESTPRFQPEPGTEPSTPEPLAIGGESDSAKRMAGGASGLEEMPVEEDGLRTLRMFLQERSRTVPQPPRIEPGPGNRSRRSL